MAQSEYLTPSSALEAVNLMLSAVDLVPVVSLLEEDTNVAAEMALKTLYSASREVQQEGWHFNQEKEFPLNPSPEGEILLPNNTLKVKVRYDLGGGYSSKDLVIRGGRLYDRRGHTFNIGATVKVDITLLLPFEDLPEAFRWYITVRGCRRYTTGKTMSSDAYKFTKQDELEARASAEQADAETDQRTVMSNPHVRRMRRR